MDAERFCNIVIVPVFLTMGAGFMVARLIGTWQRKRSVPILLWHSTLFGLVICTGLLAYSSPVLSWALGSSGFMCLAVDCFVVAPSAITAQRHSPGVRLVMAGTVVLLTVLLMVPRLRALTLMRHLQAR